MSKTNIYTFVQLKALVAATMFHKAHKITLCASLTHSYTFIFNLQQGFKGKFKKKDSIQLISEKKQHCTISTFTCFLGGEQWCFLLWVPHTTKLSRLTAPFWKEGGEYCDKTINIVQKTYTFFMAKSERGALEFTQNGYLKNKMADLGQGVLESYLGRPLMIDMSPQYCANGS